ncbi:MAG: amino acid ABC transporter permease, partial [Solirubrobacteraceae bacterium]
MSASELTKDGTGRPDELRAVPVRRPWRWVASVVVLAIAASLVRSAVTDKRFQWSVVGHYLFDSRVLHGVLGTLLLTVVSMAIG